MTDASQPDDLETTQALVDQARLEAQRRVTEVDMEEARGAGKTGADEDEDEDADPVGDASRSGTHL